MIVKPLRNRIIYLEGIDKSGKTAIRRRMYNERHLFQYCVEDRGFISRLVYHSFRKEPPEKILNWEPIYRILLREEMVGVVYCDISPSLSLQRHRAISEFPEFTEQELGIQKKIYEEVLEHHRTYWNVPVLRINTQQNKIDDCINLITQWIEEN